MHVPSDFFLSEDAFLVALPVNISGLFFPATGLIPVPHFFRDDNS